MPVPLFACLTVLPDSLLNAEHRPSYSPTWRSNPGVGGRRRRERERDDSADAQRGEGQKAKMRVGRE